MEGTISGDTFTFHEVTGLQMHREFQVNGDEMVGPGRGSPHKGPLFVGDSNCGDEPNY
jgi:hypothetical protein